MSTYEVCEQIHLTLRWIERKFSAPDVQHAACGRKIDVFRVVIERCGRIGVQEIVVIVGARHVVKQIGVPAPGNGRVTNAPQNRR